jgi:hypothetical protein
MESVSQTAQPESLHKAKNLEITYDKKDKYLYCNWIGFQNKESVISGCNIMLDLPKKKGSAKVLNDNTKVTGTWQDASDWVGKEWFPKMANAGLRDFAWIFSSNIFAELSAKKAMPESDVVKSFLSYEEAKAWLVAR